METFCGLCVKPFAEKKQVNLHPLLKNPYIYTIRAGLLDKTYYLFNKLPCNWCLFKMIPNNNK